MIASVWNSKYFVKIAIVVVIVVAIYLYIRKTQKEKEFKLLMAAVNDKSTSTGTPADLATSNAFNENYWRQFSDFAKKHNFHEKEGEYVKKIWDAKGTFSDNEDSVLSLFSGLKSKSEVSWIAFQFNGVKKRKLYDYLESFMDKGNMIKLNDIVNRLPNN